MATAPVDIAISQANQITSFCVQLNQMLNLAKALQSQNAVTPFATAWNALKTAVLAADGTLGTADGSPVQTNPIDTRVAGYGALQRNNSSADFQGGLQAVVDFVTFMSGAQVNANAARQAQVNKVSLA